MTAVIIISLIATAVLGALLWDRLVANRKLEETNQELLKRIPLVDQDYERYRLEQLTCDGIAEAVRFNGFVPEILDDAVEFRVQGEKYLIDTERLPLFFLIKSYTLNPEEWDMDLMRQAAHTLSDRLAMVKATFSDESTDISFFVAAHDRNYESLKENLSTYLRIIADGQHLLDEEYDRLVKERDTSSLPSQPYIPPVQQENKVLS